MGRGCVLPIFGVSYAFYPFVLYHYALAVAPAMMVPCWPALRW